MLAPEIEERRLLNMLRLFRDFITATCLFHGAVCLDPVENPAMESA
jgi:hypothetical protein